MFSSPLQEILLAFEYRFLRDLGLALPHPFHFFRLHVVLLNGLGQAFLCFIATQISGNPLASLPCFLISFLHLGHEMLGLNEWGREFAPPKVAAEFLVVLQLPI